jgi:hypothetical protein
MNNKAGVNRGLRCAGVLGVVAAAVVLATACGASKGPSTSTSGSGASATVTQELALTQCMRSHGLPNFPDPSASGGFSLTTTPNAPNGEIDIDSSQVQTAYAACRHLLPGGGPSLATLQQQAQQKLHQALPALLKFSQCMRSHGVPNFPDPPANGQGAGTLPKGNGINAQSPQFQAAERTCQHLAPGTVHFHTSVGS